ncbi:helicase-related protein [Clostridium sp. D43t1_170807_H7]|uniref:helicase-related protein n=1 Tax=Clostridium sp. D43t1_170807_H7 TaxID=2787140 RepID=UPI00189A8529|nr:helicase-related protein [Clostridium sp. D43t1_170807_H7]
MAGYDKFYNTIDKIENCLRKDLIGPIEENEIINDEYPLSYYVVGILWPRQSKNTEETLINDTVNLNEEELEDYIETPNESINSTNQFKPSSMAISMMIDKNVKRLDGSFKFAKYIHTKIDKEENRSFNSFKREPFEEKFEINIPDKVGSYKYIGSEILNLHDIEIIYHVRKKFEDGKKLVTISVINMRESSLNIIEQNINSLFQCKLCIKCSQKFSPIYNSNIKTKDGEMLLNEMLYSDRVNYAYGHGCSVKYEEINNEVKCIESEFIPTEIVYQMMPNKLKIDNFLKMIYWRTVSLEEGLKSLNKFIDEYKVWILEQEKKGKDLKGHEYAVQYSLDKLNICYERLKDGIDAIRNNSIAWKAFKLMNEAMLLQRVNSKGCSEESVKWFPFQLAYVLQIIPDIVNPKNKYRDVVDLLWFPTGGGKTEAYLGVCAFVIFYRRLLNEPVADGVTIIMRYTLRLLTIQQFERASALICACEYLRKEHNIPGGEISIGLWIGSSMTPNYLSDAADKLNESDKNSSSVECDPMQVTTCPWCGAQIERSCYSIEDSMIIKCNNNKNCRFHDGLPIYLIDEDIYKKKPTLLLSTVDKFARLVWEENSKVLFGDGKTLPPELILQDELHLISGPLGSIDGIYELAIEKLCTKKGFKPKYIASTATVRNAANQIKSLYDKDMFQFPPNGISVDDSFFAIKASKKDKPARRYIGLCELGGNVSDLLIRVYSNLIFQKNLFRKLKIDNDVIDQYYTIIGYFNAIKDLGASSSIIIDRISTNIKALISYKFKKLSEDAGLTVNDIKNYEVNDELTSRKTSKQIKETLNLLENSFTNEICFSYVLASNMLSVGIDINRLGVMSVFNQPKSNSEYIQATSRVGRSKPGIVLTMYNGMRSRDKSHYEQFPFYHKTLYKYVEATSVTPYSARAIEKALHCIYIALVRLTIDGMTSNADASNYRKNIPEVLEIKDYILERVKRISPEAVEDAEEYLTYISDEWDELASECEYLKYSSTTGEICLLHPAEKENSTNIPPILNALRNVDQSSNIFVKRREVE